MDISRAAQSDSASMKTISVVTLFFLPATFVSVSDSPRHTYGRPGWADTVVDSLQHELLLTFSGSRHQPKNMGDVGPILDILGICNTFDDPNVGLLDVGAARGRNQTVL